MLAVRTARTAAHRTRFGAVSVEDQVLSTRKSSLRQRAGSGGEPDTWAQRGELGVAREGSATVEADRDLRGERCANGPRLEALAGRDIVRSGLPWVRVGCRCERCTGSRASSSLLASQIPRALFRWMCEELFQHLRHSAWGFVWSGLHFRQLLVVPCVSLQSHPPTHTSGITSVFTGAVIDRYGQQVCLLLFSGILTVAAVMQLVAALPSVQSYPLLVVSRVLIGFGAEAIFLCHDALLNMWW
jgi:hypothetical protein